MKHRTSPDARMGGEVGNSSASLWLILRNLFSKGESLKGISQFQRNNNNMWKAYTSLNFKNELTLLFLIQLIESKFIVRDTCLQSCGYCTRWLLTENRHIFASPQKVIFHLHSLIYKRLFLLTLYKAVPEIPARFQDNLAIRKFYFLTVHWTILDKPVFI